MKLPPHIIRLIERVEVDLRKGYDSFDPEFADDLVRELRRYHEEKSIDPETTHALRRVSS